MLLLNWLNERWFDLLQSTGIVGGLLFAGIAWRADAKAKQLQSLFTLTQNHRQIQTEINDRPTLKRLHDPKADLRSQPVTSEERMFVNFQIIHLKNVYQASQAGLYIPPEALSKDIATFFALPVPKAVWDQVKDFQDTKFAVFVEKTLSKTR